MVFMRDFFAKINLEKTADDKIPKNSQQNKKEGKDREWIQSTTTPDPGYQWESDNVTIRHHKREPRGQSFPSR